MPLDIKVADPLNYSHYKDHYHMLQKDVSQVEPHKVHNSSSESGKYLRIDHVKGGDGICPLALDIKFSDPPIFPHYKDHHMLQMIFSDRLNCTRYV